jgi:hypothetical protein
MHFRSGDDAIFDIFPFFQKAGLEVVFVFSLPRCGGKPIFTGCVVIPNIHDLECCAETLFGFFPEVFGRDELGAACFDASDTPLQLFLPLGTPFMLVLL